MSRKRLGAVDPSRARDARANAEEQAQERRRAALGAGPPIAQVAADVGQSIDAEIARLKAENAQLSSEREGAMATAVEEGRVVLRLPLDAVNPYALTRDRRALDRTGEEWGALKASIAGRGQQAPIEVVPNGAPEGPGHDLISGLRRWSVLEELYRETGDSRFATVLAFVRQPQASVEQLVAMIEENEIRQDISFYERGRICAVAAQQGVFASLDEAIDTLFTSSHRNRRYKIRAFASLHDMAGDLLDYPEALGERLGLALVKELREGRAEDLRDHLAQRNEKFASAEDELALLNDFVSRKGAFGEPRASRARDAVDAEWRGDNGARIKARARAGKVSLTIDGLADVDQESLQVLVDWLGGRMGADQP